jgi:DNA-binding NarL/FixJ family response regulator
MSLISDTPLFLPVRVNNRTNILIADDHILLMDLWAQALSNDRRFHICGKAPSTTIAIDMARDIRPDIILMDIHIGPIDGFEATRIIRNVSPKSKIIALSGSALSAHARKMKAIGALGYVTKCSTLEEMTNAIVSVSKGKFYYCTTIRKIIYNEEKLGINTTNDGDLTNRELENY